MIPGYILEVLTINYYRIHATDLEDRLLSFFSYVTLETIHSLGHVFSYLWSLILNAAEYICRKWLGHIHIIYYCFSCLGITFHTLKYFITKPSI